MTQRHGTAYNSSNTDTHFVDMAKLNPSSRVSCGRSICFAACWYAPPGARNQSFDSALRRVVLSGKTNGVVAANVICNCTATEKE